MSRNVRFKLSGEEFTAALRFCNLVDLPLDVVAKQSLFLCLQQSYDRAREMALRNEKDSNPLATVGETLNVHGAQAESQATDATVQLGEATDSSVLADTAELPVPSK
jgi:hypothetical protein